MRVTSLHRYPVKGLSPEPLLEVVLVEKAFFPGDRLFALENGPSAFDPSAPAYQPKTRFLMLMKNARLAELVTRFDEASQHLHIARGGVEQVSGDVRTPEGRYAIEYFFERFCAGETRGRVRLLAAPDNFRFTDSIRSGFVSILNLASLRDLEHRLGAPLDPLRFRANIAVDGWEAWQEEGMVGRRLAIGDAELRVLKTIDRCPATHVDLLTGHRDLGIMGALQSAFGRISCGIYLSVKRGGRIAPGDCVRLID